MPAQTALFSLHQKSQQGCCAGPPIPEYRVGSFVRIFTLARSRTSPLENLSEVDGSVGNLAHASCREGCFKGFWHPDTELKTLLNMYEPE
jgi:hypothetical protein